MQIRDAVSKATPFVSSDSSLNHDVVILTPGKLSATCGHAGCTIDVDDTAGWKAGTVIAVDARKLKKILSSFSPEEIVVKRNVLHLTNELTHVRLSGIAKASIPVLPTLADDDFIELSPNNMFVLKTLSLLAGKVESGMGPVLGLHFSADWSCVLTSRVVLVYWRGLEGLEKPISVPHEVFAKVGKAEGSVAVTDSLFRLRQTGVDCWIRHITSKPGFVSSTLDTLVRRFRAENRLTGTVSASKLAELAVRATHSAHSPTDPYTLSPDLADAALWLSGSNAQTRFHGGVVWNHLADGDKAGQPVGLAVDYFAMSSTTLKSVVDDDEIALSFYGPTHPVILWGKDPDDVVFEIFLSPVHLP